MNQFNSRTDRVIQRTSKRVGRSEEIIPNETWGKRCKIQTRVKDLEQVVKQYNKHFIGLLGSLERKGRRNIQT